MKKTFSAVVVATLILLAIPMSAVWGEDLWQIGKSDGEVNPITGSLEYPATGAWTATFDYYVGADSDPINSPSMPGYIGPGNVCDFGGDRPCTDTAAELNIHFALDHHYDAGELVFCYDRYGSELDNLYLDGVSLGTISATEGGFGHFDFDLGSVPPGDHTIKIEYAGGGYDDGHYIDYVKLRSTFLCAVIDIKPRSCPNPVNTKSKGALPVAVAGTDKFDVYGIDPSTVTLEGVAALRWEYEDGATPVDPRTDVCDCTAEGPDGYMDITFKFDLQEILAALGAVTDGEYRVLNLVGETYDGVPIHGQDCVWVKHKVKDRGRPPVISIETFTGEGPTIRFSLGEATEVSVVVYDVRGSRVDDVLNGTLPSGDHGISWTGRDGAGNTAANGVYFCHVRAGNVEKTVKLLLLR